MTSSELGKEKEMEGCVEGGGELSDVLTVSGGVGNCMLYMSLVAEAISHHFTIWHWYV